MTANHNAKLEAKFRHALDVHQQGNLNQANKLYRSVLNARPNHSGSLHYLGMLAHQEGNSKTATRLIRKAIKCQPDYVDAIMNLGNVLQEQERYKEAEDCYRRAIQLQPENVAGYSNLSIALRWQERFEDSLAAGLNATTLDPSYLIGWYNLGNTYKIAKQYKLAIANYEQAIRLKPDFSLAHDALCQCTFQMEQRSALGRRFFRKTIRAYEQWLVCEPDNTLASFMLQAVRGDEKLTRAPDSVVRRMFDQFAPGFEQHLESLEYTLPQKVGALLQDLLGPPKAALKLLDGGCGTGLCGPAIKPWASELIGVDLSATMLEKATKKQCYDRLIEAELTGYVEQHKDVFDMAVYADTLCYFGDLQDVLHASAQALRPQGALLFTLEASTSKRAINGYQLHPSGRYSHTRAYVHDTLQGCGFSDIRIHAESLRKEAGKAVNGLVVSARKTNVTA